MKADAIYYSVLIPVGLVLIVNLIVFIFVVHTITCGRAGNSDLQTNQSKKKERIFHLSASITIFVVLG